MELSLAGVTEKKEKQFIKKGISSIEDLVYYIPRAYDDFSKETALETGPCCVVLDCQHIKYTNNGRKSYVSALCLHAPSGRSINIVWFNQEYIYRQIKLFEGHKVYMCGNVTYNYEYNNYSCANPKVFSDRISEEKRIHPIYSKITGMSEDYLVEKIGRALGMVKIDETIPEDIRTKYGVISLPEAYKKIHQPETLKDVDDARKRLVFDDLLFFVLSLEKAGRNVSKGSQFNIKSLSLYNQLISKLPYALTGDQATVLNDMIANIKDGRRLNALLQGDVSCGKSIVAFLMAAAMAGSGYQTAIMAPTQTLARQHYDELASLLNGTEVKCAYYEGTKMKAAEKKSMLSDIKNNKISIIVGTHALLGKDIEYGALALTIVDEEHKFGVLQKQALLEKAATGVHSITMSATPIPRSLSQVVYDKATQIYTIKQMPPGRQKVKTCVTDNRTAINKFINSQIGAGHQIYVVCPAIETRENREDIKSVIATLEEYQKTFPLYNIKALTGRNKKEEVADILHSFKDGTVDILIATTVIEVGVNVPNATVIVIENAENFGLAGLHQLRGRVGRGKDQGYCILSSEQTENERLKTIVSTTDGFKIAEKDLEMRGSGEFIGTKQSGDDKYINLIMSDLRNRDMYLKLKADAETLYDSGKCDLFMSVNTQANVR